MKKFEINALGEGKQIWFTIGRLKKVENLLKKPIGQIMLECDSLSIENLVGLLQIGLEHYGLKPAVYYEDAIDKALENGYDLIDIQMPVSKAVAASGILGKARYYALFPEEMTEKEKINIEVEEKN